MVYCLDTSSWLQAWVRAYPLDRFPSLWASFEALIAEGQIITSMEVRREVDKKDDGLRDWFAANTSMIVELEQDIQESALEVLRSYPRLLNMKKRKSGADPFVVATAIVRKAIVVTEEDFGTATNPKIPFVCNAMGVTQVNVLGLIRELDLTF